MQEILPFLRGDWTPGATGIWVLVAMFGIYLLREWRETRKLSAEDRQARREGYARQVENLQVENRSLRGDLSQLHAEHLQLHKEHEDYRRLCRLETDQLRKQVEALEDEIAGIARKRRPPRVEL